ncbi:MULTISPECIES: universal stress protein [Pseudonocardiaceae]|uniref:Universal stress protein UspA n=2 Tax=Pseudonocardiaceae TaxID=2070 RepID=A0A2V4AET8_9PSEU|nr:MULTISPECIES: universal stress protein [Pseudonocardiaceae]MBE1579615.1 nucleotide-binding universal stress UspA family protein [Amycolatopsis roodepoortensis]PXY18075.1 universal stress protein UspA [Prauserella muralis]PXY18476.1 universal stress protein UspA [Prauserella coralliicola]TWE15062.1 nucleotide-binding universal stress UspA family protein [Prauserella muralis]
MPDDTQAVSRVLVPLDGSDEAQRALLPALRVAQTLDCPIELVTVYDPVNGRWARDLDDIAEQLPYDQVEVAVVGAGWPGEVIADMAGEEPGTLVCMSAQHRDEVDRLVLGSVSAHLLRTSRAPTLVVGPGYELSRLPRRYERLVVCLDGSGRAETALAVATTWACLFATEVELVHVAFPRETPGNLEALGAGLSRAADALADDGVQASATLLTGDNPAASIAELLQSRPATLAITATHGSTGLTRLLLGSVTTELLTRSPTPVLVAPVT